MSASPQSANMMMGGQWRELQGPPINNFLEVIPKTLLKGMTSFKKIRPSHLNSLSSKLQLLAPFKQSPGRFLVKATKIEKKYQNRFKPEDLAQ